VRYAALLLLSCAAFAVAGCGSEDTASPTELALEREDLVAVSRALQRAEDSVGREVAATKAAWRLIVDGLPADTSTIAPSLIRAAAEDATRLEAPALFEEAQGSELTGPGALIAGLFHSFNGLATHGWQMIDAAIAAIEHGSPATASFARANSGLYVESIYDAHFTLAQIGKKLLAGYRALGAGAAFGPTLSEDEVNTLASVYSEASDRLHPHVGVRLGT
jgi:hypothetical protein